MSTHFPHYEQLQPEDRVTLASLRQQHYSIRAIAQQLGRSPSTISRELRRNSQSQAYGSLDACQRCRQRRIQARPNGKLHHGSILFSLVHHFLRERWSPEQIALTLARLHSRGHELRVSHETIYNCIYAQPVGALRRELVACLRQARVPSACRAARGMTGAARFPTC